jgi:hypothetical protein
MNYAEYIVTDNGSKWEKEKKIWSEVRESKLLDEEIEEEKSTRKIDHGQLNKQKNPSVYSLEHLAGKKERQVAKALKTRVKLT